MDAFRHDPIGYITEQLLVRHALAGQIPLALLLAAIFLAWRAAGKRLRGAVAIKTSLVIAGIVTGLFLITGVIYARSWFFLDHVEPNVVGISEMFATGRPIYHATDAAPRYALLYGPNLFILYGTLLKLFAHSVPALKVCVILGIAASVALSFASYRKRVERSLAWIGAAYVALAIGSYGDLPLWVRAEPALLILAAAGMLAAVRCGPIAGAIWIAVAAGLAINVKAHAPLYLVSAWMIFPHRWQIRSLLIAAVTAAIVAAMPFVLFRDQASIELYMTWLRAAGKHGLKASFLARNIEALLYLASPVLALFTFAALTRPRALRSWWTDFGSLFVGTLIATVMVAVIASKPGAGPWHLMPFVVPFGMMLATLCSSLPTGLSEARSESVSEDRLAGVGVRAIVGSFMLFSLVITALRLPFVWRDMRKVNDAAIVAELRQIVADHPGQNVYLGVGGDRDYPMSFFRPVLIGLRQPYLLDYAAVMDMKLSGLPMPAATRDAISSDRSAIWLFPRDSKPFSVPTIYDQHTRAFDRDFDAMFESNFHRTNTSQNFDIWTTSPAR